MRASTVRILFAAFGFAVALSTAAQSQSAQAQRPILAGLKRLSVAVELGGCEKARLDSTQLLTISQLAFRRMGLEIEGAVSYPRFTLLAICQVVTEKANGDPNYFAVVISARLEEAVRSLRPSASGIYFATTWEQFARVASGPSEMERVSESIVAGILVRFENQWREANPKNP